MKNAATKPRHDTNLRIVCVIERVEQRRGPPRTAEGRPGDDFDDAETDLGEVP
jgi:hypothetical protein